MKILKRIGLGILAIIVLILVIALFVKKELIVDREVVINQPVPEVFAYVSHLKNQEQFSKWVMADPSMKKDYRGIDGTVGFIYAWDGNKDAGKGEQEIKKIDPGKRIDMEIRFEKPMESVAQSFFATEDAGNNQTKLKWNFTTKMAYPFNIMRLFFSVEDMLGKDMEISLGNLKTILEK